MSDDEIPVVILSAAAFLNIVCKVNCIRQPDCSAFDDSTIFNNIQFLDDFNLLLFSRSLNVAHGALNVVGDDVRPR